jgi:polyhydroxyalkanoate synthesis regulator protein
MNQFEDMARQNMALFQRAASLLNPLTGNEGERDQQAAAGNAAASSDAHDTSAQIRELNERIEALQKQLGELIEVQQQKR